MLPNIEFSILLRPLLHDQKAVSFRKHEVIFSHGAPSDSMFYRGSVKLTVRSANGKEALIGFFNKGTFFGESCLAPDSPTRFHTATALTNMQPVKLDGNEIKTILRTNAQLAYAFVTYLLRRNAQIQRDLANNLIDSSEDRLGRCYRP
jgi:CRP/FNR family transcriptional regulator, cyclic AMP receptor protein